MKRLTIYRDGALEINCENCPETKICRSAELTESDCLYFLTERLAEYEEAEEQGLLVWLPCKLGDTVWIKGDKFPAEIEEIRVTDDGIYFVYVEYDKGYEETEVWGNDEFTLSDIGKTVFLTREEAEKALEGMKNEA